MILTISLGVNAQTPTFDWAVNMGGTSFDEGSDIALDALGNIYSIGNFNGTADFEPGTGVNNLISNGQTDIFISKVDANGNFVWAKSMGGVWVDNGNSIALDLDGNIYTTGYFKNTVDFDPGVGVSNLTSNGQGDIFVSKLDASGSFVWAKSMGSTNSDEGTSIKVDSFGNVYTTGSFSGTVDFDPGVGVSDLISNGNTDVFVSKLDSNGDFVWAKKIGGANNDNGTSINIDALGNVYTTGKFSGTVDFDPSAATSNLMSNGGFNEGFVTKWEANGDFVWAQQMGGGSANASALDVSGNIFTIGNFNGTIDFDPTANTVNLTSSALTDIFVSKLDGNGNFVWAKGFGGTNNDNGISIAVDAFSNVYTTGQYYGTGDFDPGVGVSSFTSNGFYEIFISKLDANGNFVWASSLGNTSHDEGNGIVVDTLNNIYTTGYFRNTVDFDHSVSTTNLTSNGGGDVFIQKLNQCSPSTGIFTQISCDSFEWVDGDGNTYTSSNNSATHILTSVGGCDSVITLNLTINNSNTGTDIQATCNSYTWIDGITYYSSNNTATHTLTNAANCDSVVTLNLTITDVSTTLSGLTISANNITATSYQWINCLDNTALQGETNSSFTATTNGDYAIIIAANACSDTSDCVSISTVGINDLAFENISVYPNPTNGIVNLNISETLSSIRIMDLTGKTIQVFNAESAKLDISNFTAGIYFLEIANAERKSVVKIVKK